MNCQNQIWALHFGDQNPTGAIKKGRQFCHLAPFHHSVAERQLPHALTGPHQVPNSGEWFWTCEASFCTTEETQRQGNKRGGGQSYLNITRPPKNPSLSAPPAKRLAAGSEAAQPEMKLDAGLESWSTLRSTHHLAADCWKDDLTSDQPFLLLFSLYSASCILILYRGYGALHSGLLRHYPHCAHFNLGSNSHGTPDAHRIAQTGATAPTRDMPNCE